MKVLQSFTPAPPDLSKSHSLSAFPRDSPNRPEVHEWRTSPGPLTSAARLQSYVASGTNAGPGIRFRRSSDHPRLALQVDYPRGLRVTASAAPG